MHSLKQNSYHLWKLVTLMVFITVSEPAFSQKGERPPMPVQTLAVEEESLPFIKTYPVRLEPFKEVEVHARVTAHIKKQLYTEGQKVKAGQLLYELDDRRAKAAYDIAKANLQSAKVRMNQAETTYKRTLKVSKNSAVSQQEVDDAYATWQAAQSDLQAAQAELVSKKIEWDDTTVEAEISGLIGEKQQDVGDLVDPVSGNTLMNSIRQTDQLYGLFSVSDKDRESLFALQHQGILTLSDQPKIRLINKRNQILKTGQLDFQDSQIDQATASQLYRAQFENADQRLLPGQLMRVQVEHGQWKKVMPIPQKAVIQNGPQAFVYVAADGKAQMRPVNLAGAYQDQWLVSEGLQKGDRVIVGNLIKLRPNSPVQILPENSPTAETK